MEKIIIFKSVAKLFIFHDQLHVSYALLHERFLFSHVTYRNTSISRLKKESVPRSYPTCTRVPRGENAHTPVLALAQAHCAYIEQIYGFISHAQLLSTGVGFIR